MPVVAGRASRPRKRPRLSRGAAGRLRELQQLRAEGLISEAEHEARRGRLLDGL